MHGIRNTLGAAACLLALAACASEAPPRAAAAEGGTVADDAAPALPEGAALLAPGVAWLRGEFAPPRQPDGNSVVFAGPDGLLVVDTGRHPAYAERLHAVADAFGLPVTDVVNSHWHLDHVGGNPALRAAWPGLAVHASPAIDGALSGFLARYADQLRRMLAAPADPGDLAAWRAELDRIENGAALRPDDVVRAGGPRRLAGRDLQIGFERAATEGDLWLFDPASGVLAAGDLVTLPAPFFDTACPERWQQALARLEAVPFAVLVPGHGEPMDRAGFQRYRQAFDALLACAASDAPVHACEDAWAADLGPLLPAAQRANAELLLDYYFSAVLRSPAPLPACAG